MAASAHGAAPPTFAPGVALVAVWLLKSQPAVHAAVAAAAAAAALDRNPRLEVALIISLHCSCRWSLAERAPRRATRVPGTPHRLSTPTIRLAPGWLPRPSPAMPATALCHSSSGDETAPSTPALPCRTRRDTSPAPRARRAPEM